MKNEYILIAGLLGFLWWKSRNDKKVVVDTEQNSGSGEARNLDVILTDTKVDSHSPTSTSTNTYSSLGCNSTKCFRIGML
jgi:hypothetical protein